jgi:hypothetical protein
MMMIIPFSQVYLRVDLTAKGTIIIIIIIGANGTIS